MGVECIQGVFFTERAAEELSLLQTTEEYRAFLPFIAVSMKYQCTVCKYGSDILLKIAQHLVDGHIAIGGLPPAPLEGQPYTAPPSDSSEKPIKPQSVGDKSLNNCGKNDSHTTKGLDFGTLKNYRLESEEPKVNEVGECKDGDLLIERVETSGRKQRERKIHKKKQACTNVAMISETQRVTRGRKQQAAYVNIKKESNEITDNRIPAIIPKKRPIKIDETLNDSINSDQSSDDSMKQETVSETEKGNSEPESSSDELMVDELSEEETAVRSQNQARSKLKRRGRPPGSKNKAKASEENTPQPRKRGRPRKYLDKTSEKKDTSGLTRHEREDIKARTCALCGKLIDELGEVIKHYEVEHNYVPKPYYDVPPESGEKVPNTDEESPLGRRKKFTSTTEQCRFCGKLFLKENIVKHIILKHIWKRIQRREQRKQTVLCYICGRVFQHIQNLERHVAEHLGRVKKRQKVNQTFVCDVCGYTTPENTRLKKHYMARHQGKSPYQCSHCDYKTWERSSYRCHTFRHQDNKKYRCTQNACSYQCIQKKQLRAHMKRHHGLDLPKVYGQDAAKDDRVVRVKTDTGVGVPLGTVSDIEIISNNQVVTEQPAIEYIINTQPDSQDVVHGVILDPHVVHTSELAPPHVVLSPQSSHPLQQHPVPTAAQPNTVTPLPGENIIVGEQLEQHQVHQQEPNVLIDPLLSTSGTVPAPITTNSELINLQPASVSGSGPGAQGNMASLMTFATAAAAVAGFTSSEECTALEQDIARALIQINPVPQSIINPYHPSSNLQHNMDQAGGMH